MVMILKLSLTNLGRETVHSGSNSSKPGQADRLVCDAACSEKHQAIAFPAIYLYIISTSI
jgi:hypothetical protein